MDLDSTDLEAVATIDLSLSGNDEGNQILAKTLLESIRTKGFFYVTNFGISQEDVDTQFSLGQQFYELPLEEKLKYQPDLDSGDYNGYRPAGRRVLSGGIKDKTEVWNMASEFTSCLRPSRSQELNNDCLFLQPRTATSLNLCPSSSRTRRPSSSPSQNSSTTRSSTLSFISSPSPWSCRPTSSPRRTGGRLTMSLTSGT